MSQEIDKKCIKTTEIVILRAGDERCIINAQGFYKDNGII